MQPPSSPDVGANRNRRRACGRNRHGRGNGRRAARGADTACTSEARLALVPQLSLRRSGGRAGVAALVLPAVGASLSPPSPEHRRTRPLFERASLATRFDIRKVPPRRTSCSVPHRRQSLGSSRGARPALAPRGYGHRPACGRRREICLRLPVQERSKSAGGSGALRRPSDGRSAPSGDQPERNSGGNSNVRGGRRQPGQCECPRGGPNLTDVGREARSPLPYEVVWLRSLGRRQPPCRGRARRWQAAVPASQVFAPGEALIDFRGGPGTFAS